MSHLVKQLPEAKQSLNEKPVSRLKKIEIQHDKILSKNKHDFQIKNSFKKISWATNLGTKRTNYIYSGKR